MAAEPLSYQLNKEIQIDRLVALWALSEAALGGVLHAFRVPLTGLLVNSAAVILIVFIASFSPKRGTILKATFIVMIVKGIVSPHTPLAAYIAVGFQGIMGELLLRSSRYLLPSSIVFGVITLLQSSVQKIILLTFIYGKVLWESIDIFGKFVANQLSFIPFVSEDFGLSAWIIFIYILLHLGVGVLAGIFAARLPEWVKAEINQNSPDFKLYTYKHMNAPVIKKRKKKWYHKITTLAIFTLAFGIVILSYFYPEISGQQGMRALIMILRAISIMLVWYMLIGPWILKLYRRYMSRKQNAYTREVQQTLEVLPVFHHIISETWQSSRSFRGIQRLKMFFIFVLVNILSLEI